MYIESSTDDKLQVGTSPLLCSTGRLHSAQPLPPLSLSSAIQQPVSLVPPVSCRHQQFSAQIRWLALPWTRLILEVGEPQRFSELFLILELVASFYLAFLRARYLHSGVWEHCTSSWWWIGQNCAHYTSSKFATSLASLESLSIVESPATEDCNLLIPSSRLLPIGSSDQRQSHWIAVNGFSSCKFTRCDVHALGREVLHISLIPREAQLLVDRRLSIFPSWKFYRSHWITVNRSSRICSCERY